MDNWYMNEKITLNMETIATLGIYNDQIVYKDWQILLGYI